MKASIERKRQKHAILCRQDYQADFIATRTRAQLLECLDAHIRAKNTNTGARAEKGVLLFEQSCEFLPALTGNLPIFDQIPFEACGLQHAELKAMLPANEYQILLSNLVFNWVDPADFIDLIGKLLVAEGICYFSAFGPQTARHSRDLLAKLDRYPHFSDYYALQDIGDALSAAGFQEIVVETYNFKLEYKTVDMLLEDANRIFGINMHPEKSSLLSSKGLLTKFTGLIEKIIREKGCFTETVEVLITHARKPLIERIPVTVV